MITERIAVHCVTEEADIRLPGKGNSNSRGARPVHQIISMMKWIRTSRLPIKYFLSVAGGGSRRTCGFRVQGSGCRVQGSGFRVQGSGFRVGAPVGRGLRWCTTPPPPGSAAGAPSGPPTPRAPP